MPGLQAGVFEGQSPLTYNPTNPINLFLFQVVIILIVSNLLHTVLSRLRQPKLVSEVIGGLILGPSVLGHVPNYMDTIFPAASFPVFTNASTLGLCFLLFIVGLETDVTTVRKHWRAALSVAGVGIIIPFGLGVAVALGLYESIELHKEDHADFGVFVLFIGLSMAITAFPVLARILMELNLLISPVGVIALSAGVANDVIGWSLLATSVALAQASTGAVAVYVLLCCAGWIVLMVCAVQPFLGWFVQDSLSESAQPEEKHLGAISILILVSSLFTAIIGIHPIFGAFLVGAIVPKQGGFHDKLAMRFAPMVYNVLLPPFFALSGINTDISSLNSGIAWVYVFAVVAIAFVGKVCGGFIAAKLCSMKTRESVTIGILMSCKGIVELIALNIGLQAKIISQETFTIMVIMAILSTGVTQPLVIWIFPEHLRSKKIDLVAEGSAASTPTSTSSTCVHHVSIDECKA